MTNIKVELSTAGKNKLSFSGERLSEAALLSFIENVIAPSMNPSYVVKQAKIDENPKLAESEPLQKAPLPRTKVEPVKWKSTPTSVTNNEPDVEEEFEPEEDFATLLENEEIVHDEGSGYSLEDKFDAAKIKQALQQPDGEAIPDFYVTGIKYRERRGETVPTYKTFYTCPKCTESGKHYIPEGTKTVDCHNCSATLVVQPATENGFGLTDEHRDNYGNYYIANTVHFTNGVANK